MEPWEEIEALVGGFEERGPGSDAERRAATHLAERLRSLGREAEVQPINVWPNYALTHTIHAVMAIVGSVLSVYVPPAGVAILFLAAISTIGDLTGSFQLVRRLTGRRSSQNVLSTEDGGRPGTLILVAHYDAARTGAVFTGRWLERLAVLGKRIRRPIGPFEPFLWSVLVIFACSMTRLFGVESLALTAVQFVPTVILIVSVPFLVDIALSGLVPGANDNASGVATALSLAERYSDALHHFELWVLFTGAHEGMLEGMRRWLRRHRRELDPTRTVFVGIDAVGAGTVRFSTREGYAFASRFHPALLSLCRELALSDEDENRFGAQPLVSRLPTDVHLARLRGYPAVAISCANALDYVPVLHRPIDTPERVDDEALERARGFCAELIELIDEEIGPDLERQDVAAEGRAGEETSA